MTKSELIANMAEEAGISKAAAGKALDAFTNSIVNTVANGDKVTLVGFGTFSASDRAARTGRNPQTGEEIQIAASRVPKFKAGATFKNAVNGK